MGVVGEVPPNDIDCANERHFHVGMKSLLIESISMFIFSLFDWFWVVFPFKFFKNIQKKSTTFSKKKNIEVTGIVKKRTVFCRLSSLLILHYCFQKIFSSNAGSNFFFFCYKHNFLFPVKYTKKLLLFKYLLCWTHQKEYN